jgi:phosphopantothenoylcysteine decarboxylase/phosphopantothenate--cysteine ligase
MTSLAEKTVLLIIGGGIAAYKTHELIRLLKTRGCRVKIIMTRAAEEFVTPLSLASLSGEKVHTALFNLTDELEMGHIQLSRAADLIVVAPATADLMAKMAHGFADDLASTALLATDRKVLVAPAMNVRMWQHPATQHNIDILRQRGIATVGPNDGEMACGEFGPGRMAEPADILEAIIGVLGPATQPLAGRRVLITAGPTREAIDPVRFISNHSSGKQGYAIAEAAAALGAETILVSGPVSLNAPTGVKRISVESAQDMLSACRSSLPADIAIFTAAVADWRIARRAEEKLKKGPGGPPVLELVENPDILKTIARDVARRPQIVVGFAAETGDVLRYAADKLEAKGCDIIVANDVRVENNVFGGDRNTVHLVSAEQVESWPTMSKQDVAQKLMERLAQMLLPQPKSEQ